MSANGPGGARAVLTREEAAEKGRLHLVVAPSTNVSNAFDMGIGILPNAMIPNDLIDGDRGKYSHSFL
jgi:hypothetical protein